MQTITQDETKNKQTNQTKQKNDNRIPKKILTPPLLICVKYQVKNQKKSSICTRKPGDSTAFCTQHTRREISQHRGEISTFSLRGNS